jgi:hypothetical protein
MPSSQLSVSQVQELIDTFSYQEQLAILENLERKTFKQRLDDLLERVRFRVADDDITMDEIVAEVKSTRREMYEERQRNKSNR